MSDEIDALVATKVMGWVVHPRNTAHYVRNVDDPYPAGWTCGSYRFNPSNSIAHAWQVVQHMADIEHRNAIWWNCTAGAFICIDIDDGLPKSLGRIMFDCPHMMPLAICLAALEAFGVERPNLKDDRAVPAPVHRVVGRCEGDK